MPQGPYLLQLAFSVRFLVKSSGAESFKMFHLVRIPTFEQTKTTSQQKQESFKTQSAQETTMLELVHISSFESFPFLPRSVNPHSSSSSALCPAAASMAQKSEPDVCGKKKPTRPPARKRQVLQTVAAAAAGAGCRKVSCLIDAYHNKASASEQLLFVAMRLNSSG